MDKDIELFFLGLLIGIAFTVIACGIFVKCSSRYISKDDKVCLNKTNYRVLDYKIEDKQIILDVYKLEK